MTGHNGMCDCHEKHVRYTTHVRGIKRVVFGLAVLVGQRGDEKEGYDEYLFIILYCLSHLLAKQREQTVYISCEFSNVIIVYQVFNVYGYHRVSGYRNRRGMMSTSSYYTIYLIYALNIRFMRIFQYHYRILRV